MPPKVLITDDDLEIVELLKFTFESEGYQVVTAHDGEEGFRVARDERPDIIILDVNMPKMTGFEVCEKIRQDGSTCLTPVIMLTSYAKIKDKITGLKLGADDYLNKPFEPLELVARVETLLRRIRETISASPLTVLPGNVSIETEIKRRLESKERFAVIYTDIDYFKSYNDTYGFERGDSVIKLTATILRAAIGAIGEKDDFLGHIGGDDFVIVTTHERAGALAQMIVKYFDDMALQQYEPDARERGYLVGLDRQGVETRFPIMSISLGVALVEPGKFKHYSQVVDSAKDLLKKAKPQAGSIFLIG